jgi:predicted ATP-grasp superfamily ATP-dependent carboligase
MTRAVPARRHDPNMQNFIYKGKTDPSARRRDEEQVARLAQKVRETLGLNGRAGNDSN